MEVARICEDLLEDEARAEGVYKRVIAIDPSDPALVIPAAQALGRIYAAGARHEELAGALGVEVAARAGRRPAAASSTSASAASTRPCSTSRRRPSTPGDRASPTTRPTPRRSAPWSGSTSARGQHRELVSVLRKREQAETRATSGAAR